MTTLGRKRVCHACKRALQDRGSLALGALCRLRGGELEQSFDRVCVSDSLPQLSFTTWTAKPIRQQNQRNDFCTNMRIMHAAPVRVPVRGLASVMCGDDPRESTSSSIRSRSQAESLHLKASHPIC